MTSPSRALAILNLFNEEHPVWHTDEINASLDYTRATGYRYVKDLVEAGLLQKIAAGRYSLGPRIIELDYQLRRSDPLLLAAVAAMDELVKEARLDAVLTTIFGSKVVDIYRASMDLSLQLSYGRGRPRPLFLAASPKVILANLPRAQLVKLYASAAAEAAKCGMGNSWTEFRANLAYIRREDFWATSGELQQGMAAAAVPIFNAEGDIAAALAVVGPSTSLEATGQSRLKALLKKARGDIQDRIKQNFRACSELSS
jgi:DNA-binding IclR family transcriptional regulator